MSEIMLFYIFFNYFVFQDYSPEMQTQYCAVSRYSSSAEHKWPAGIFKRIKFHNGIISQTDSYQIHGELHGSSQLWFTDLQFIIHSQPRTEQPL